MEQGASLPPELYKIISIEHWQQSLNKRKLILAEESLTHLMTKEQVLEITQKSWNNSTNAKNLCFQDFIILKLSLVKLMDRLLCEKSHDRFNANYYLHKGTEIPFDAILSVTYIKNPIES